MLDILSAIWSFITGLIGFVGDLIASAITLIRLLVDSVGYLSGALFLLPGELAVFGVVFITIMILNRISHGDNSGGS